jgi:hypothetical protein
MFLDYIRVRFLDIMHKQAILTHYKKFDVL